MCVSVYTLMFCTAYVSLSVFFSLLCLPLLYLVGKANGTRIHTYLARLVSLCIVHVCFERFVMCVGLYVCMCFANDIKKPGARASVHAFVLCCEVFVTRVCACVRVCMFYSTPMRHFRIHLMYIIVISRTNT